MEEVYSAIDVAKYIIYFCKQNHYSISNLKLQKLLYFVQAQFLVERNKEAFDEKIEAWDFGPVVPTVYRQFKIWGSAEIPKKISKNANQAIYLSDQILIDDILEQCAPYSAVTLMQITHNQAPWRNVYERNHNNIITNRSIKEFFENN